MKEPVQVLIIVVSAITMMVVCGIYYIEANEKEQLKIENLKLQIELKKLEIQKLKSEEKKHG